MSGTRPKIVFLGLRGFPEVQGGIEKHVEALAPLLVRDGWEVEVIGRRPYLPSGKPMKWRGVTILPVWAPRRKNLETILHTALGVLVAARRGADVLHVHAIGPALLVPLARLLGLRVVVTHHGYDYDRSKWGRFARLLLRWGERSGMRFGQARIAISGDVARTMERRYGVPVAFVPNGVDIVEAPPPGETLARFGLLPRRYVVTVGRLVPEKRQLDLIAGFARLADPGLKLIIIGAADHPDDYTRAVEAAAQATPNVVMTGFQRGEALAELFGHAALFVLPSSHEGMPIALLEALAFGLPVVVSDIVAHRQMPLHPDDYFEVGDVGALTSAMRRHLDRPMSEAEIAAQIARIRAAYSWDSVAERTAAIYRDMLRDAPGRPPVSASAGSTS